VPRILRKHLLPGAREAEGVAVVGSNVPVADGLRAFTSAAWMMHLPQELTITLSSPFSPNGG